MATTVGIINKGKLLFEGQLTELEEDEKDLLRPVMMHSLNSY